MAYALSLSDSSNTIDFLGVEGVGDSYCLLEDGGLDIEVPEKLQTRSGPGTGRTGQTLIGNIYKNRTIKIKFEIGGTTRANIFDKKQLIERIIDNANTRQRNRLVQPVTLQYQVDGTSAPVYFDVVDAELNLPQDIMSLEKMDWSKGTDKVIKEFELELECQPFARGAEETIATSASITNGGTNYVSYTSTAIKGDVPGPLRIVLTNTYTSARDLSVVYVGLRDYASPASFVQKVTASDAYSYQGSIIGGYIVWIASTGKMATWIVGPSGADGGNNRGKVRAILIGSNLSDECRLYLKSTYRGVTPLHSYREARPGAGSATDYLDLGTIDLDPFGLYVDTPSGQQYLELQVKTDEGVTPSLSVWGLFFFPADDYKYRKWRYHGWNCSKNSYIEDIGKYNYVLHNGTDRIIEPSGFPIHARPGEDGRLYFTMIGDTGDWDSARSASVSLYHTPYYLDISGS